MNSLIARTALTAGLAATALAFAPPATARHYHNRWGHHHGNGTGTAIAVGVVGLALGAAIASDHSHDRDRDDYYGRHHQHAGYDDEYYGSHGYYPQDGYYASQYQGRSDCHVEQRWDNYYRRTVQIQVCR